jgi:hypothetical protein
MEIEAERRYGYATARSPVETKIVVVRRALAGLPSSLNLNEWHIEWVAIGN